MRSQRSVRHLQLQKAAQQGLFLIAFDFSTQRGEEIKSRTQISRRKAVHATAISEIAGKQKWGRRTCRELIRERLPVLVMLLHRSVWNFSRMKRGRCMFLATWTGSTCFHWKTKSSVVHPSDISNWILLFFSRWETVPRSGNRLPLIAHVRL